MPETVVLTSSRFVYCIYATDELSIAMKNNQNIKMVDEMIPVSYNRFQNNVIRAGVRAYRGGEVFPILQYRHFE